MSVALSELRERIRRLPDRLELRRQVGTLSRYAHEVGVAATSLGNTAAVVQAMRGGFRGARLGKAKVAITGAGRAAERLSRLVHDNSGAVGTAEAEELVVGLKDQAQAARAGVRDEWRRQQALVKGRWEKTVAAAQRAHLTGVPGLSSAMADLGRLYTLEPTPQLVAESSAVITVLGRSISELHLEGKVGEFLEAVQEGRADPRAVLDPEVSGFLDQSRLWDILVVGFR